MKFSKHMLKIFLITILLSTSRAKNCSSLLIVNMKTYTIPSVEESLTSVYIGETIPIQNSTQIGLISRDAIIIQWDWSFTPENGVTGGSGTADDPYIIENWEINVSKDGYKISDAKLGPAPRKNWIVGLLLTYTSAHVIIRNLSIYSDQRRQSLPWEVGIVTANAKNCIIEN